MKQDTKLRNVCLSGWPYLAILVISLIIVTPQMVAHSTILGSDSIFHFNRFYEAAKQIQNGNWSFFQTNYAFQQSGRIINAIYGPLFAYLNGALLGILGTWYRYQIFSAVMIYWIAGIGMYKLSRYLEAKPFISLLITIIYMNIGWLPRWETAQNMTAWGAALAPYLAFCGIRMVKDPDSPVNSWKLLAIMTVIIQIHMLSSLFYAMTLVPFFVVGMLHAKQPRQMLLATVKAAVGTIILTANVWGALLTVELENKIAQPAPFKLTNNVLITSWQNGSRDFILLPILIIFVLQIISVIIHFKKSLPNTITTLVGAFFLLLSSKFIPWGILEKSVPVLERFLQFPDRFTVIAYPLLLAGFVMTIQRFEHANLDKALLVLLSGVALWAMVANMRNIYHVSKNYHTDAVIVKQGGVSKHSPHDHMIRLAVHTTHPGQLLLLVEKRSPDYLPITKDNLGKKYVRSYAYEGQIINHVNEFSHTVLPGGRLKISWNSNRSGWIRVPLITYHQSQLSLNGRRLKNYPRSSIGAPYVHQRKGHNVIIMKFVQPLWVSILITVAVLGNVCCLIYGIWLLVQRWVSERKHAIIQQK